MLCSLLSSYRCTDLPYGLPPSTQEAQHRQLQLMQQPPTGSHATSAATRHTPMPFVQMPEQLAYQAQAQPYGISSCGGSHRSSQGSPPEPQQQQQYQQQSQVQDAARSAPAHETFGSPGASIAGSKAMHADQQGLLQQQIQHQQQPQQEDKGQASGLQVPPLNMYGVPLSNEGGGFYAMLVEGEGQDPLPSQRSLEALLGSGTMPAGGPDSITQELHGHNSAVIRQLSLEIPTFELSAQDLPTPPLDQSALQWASSVDPLPSVVGGSMVAEGGIAGTTVMVGVEGRGAGAAAVQSAAAGQGGSSISGGSCFQGYAAAAGGGGDDAGGSQLPRLVAATAAAVDDIQQVLSPGISRGMSPTAAAAAAGAGSAGTRSPQALPVSGMVAAPGMDAAAAAYHAVMVWGRTGASPVVAAATAAGAEVSPQGGVVTMGHPSPTGVGTSGVGVVHGAAAARGQVRSSYPGSPASAVTPVIVPLAANGGSDSRLHSPQQGQQHHQYISAAAVHSGNVSPISPFALHQGVESMPQLQGSGGAWGSPAAAMEPQGGGLLDQGFLQRNGHLNQEEVKRKLHVQTQEILRLQGMIIQQQWADARAAAAAAGGGSFDQQGALDPRYNLFQQGGVVGFGYALPTGDRMIPAAAAVAAGGIAGSSAGYPGGQVLGRGAASPPGNVGAINGQQQLQQPHGTPPNAAGRPKRGPRSGSASQHAPPSTSPRYGHPTSPTTAGAGVGMGRSGASSSAAAAGHNQQQQLNERVRGYRMETERREGGAERWHQVKYISLLPARSASAPGELPPQPLPPPAAAQGARGVGGRKRGIAEVIVKHSYEEQVLPPRKRQNAANSNGSPQTPAAAGGARGNNVARQVARGNHSHGAGAVPGLIMGADYGMAGPFQVVSAAAAAGMVYNGGMAYAGAAGSAAGFGGQYIGAAGAGGVIGGGMPPAYAANVKMMGMSRVQSAPGPMAGMVGVGGVPVGQVDGYWQQARV